EMLDNLELISTMLDHDGRLTYCNDYFLRLTGWQREEVLGKSWFDLFVLPEQIGEMQKAFGDLLAGQRDIRHHTNEIVTRSGEKRLIQWNNSLLYSASGEAIGTASIAEDITERRRLEQQLFRTQRLESLGTLAGGIAHDLNNLLLPILMGITLLKRFEPAEASMRTIENIERSVKRGSELVKQVLLFARGSETSRNPVHLGAIISEVEAIIRSTFPKDITIEISIAGDLKFVTGDATQLTQVLLNLCVNARDAMPQGGLIAISAENKVLSGKYELLHSSAPGGRYVALTVTDTGEGMTQKIIERIFDPFFTTKEVGKGTGLGLSTVQGIVTNHGGFVTVVSEPGDGSAFTVYLPIRGTEKAEIAPVIAVEEPPHGNGELILLVDDEASVLGMTKQTLEVFGYEVLTADDGAQAIGTFSHHQGEIDLVITDMAMPIIDGPALIAALNRMAPHVRIIATTGNISGTYMTRIAKTGVTHILTKPYSADHLLRTIADVLRSF
ncbi:MAG: hypothetical protein QOE82_2365, partial [Thermoanaerobaculia bacterium]|nr:hypothetical protein [Thermoanaerobaculia bacterium]